MLIKQGDLTVIGGGLAGVCAAIAAARHGVIVNLINNRPVLGGNSSSEIRVWTRGATGGGNRYSEEMGILGEMKLENLYKNPIGNPYLWDQTILDFVNREQNINLFLNTHVDQAEVENNQITQVTGVQLGTEKHFTFESDLFVDATGDGTIGYLAGAHFRTGREGKEEFNEEFAPTKADNYSQGSSILFHSKRMNTSVPYIPPDSAYSQEHVRKLIQKGKRVVHPNLQGCDYWWFEYGGELDTIKNNEEIAAELRKLVFGIWDYVKNSGEFTDVEDLTLEWVGSIPGKRSSRRFIGNYILTQNDIIHQTKFDDAVCTGGWHLDFHPPGGIYSKEDACQQMSVNVYSIPLRCLYSKNITNLFLAGRDISTTYAAFASTRIMNTCATTGQAVGTAASVCQQQGKLPGQLTITEVEQLQQLLIKSDQYIPGVQNNSRDYALEADISVSSTTAFKNELSAYTVGMEKKLYLALPLSRDAKQLGLFVDCARNTELSLKVYVNDRPENYQCDKLLGTYRKRILPGARQWVLIDLDLSVSEEKILIELEANPDLAIHCSNRQLAGVFLTEELLGHTHFNPCFQVNPEQDVYDGNNVINGFNRPHGKPNLWISGKLTNSSEWLILDLKDEKPISEIRLFFNSDLGKELTNLRPEKWADSHRIAPQLKICPELVKAYTVSVWQKGQWEMAKRVTNNYQRLNVICLDSLVTSKIKIEFEETHGSEHVEVFEVRVY